MANLHALLFIQYGVAFPWEMRLDKAYPEVKRRSIGKGSRADY
jgi:hypothetical protein